MDDQIKASWLDLDQEKLPKHIAIIMDGNGRWAQKRNLPRSVGHRAGVESLRKIVTMAVEVDLPVLTVFAFSTENWKRPLEEINVLMYLLVEYLKKELKRLKRNGVRFRSLGDIAALPEKVVKEIIKAEKETADNTGLMFNVALNYGSRSEILRAAQTLVKQIELGMVQTEEVDEKLFSSLLFTAGLPDPDLLIRPSGEIRISNFLLWQIAYSEIWLTDVLWPDFSENDLYQAVKDYQKRKRRFGGI